MTSSKSRRIIKEDIDRWFNTGIYPQSRTLYIGSMSDDDAGGDFVEQPGIYWNTAQRVIKAFHLFEISGQHGDRPITIIMNSVGGDWDQGMAIYNAIQYSNNYVVIIAMSHARSMTSLILQAGDYRILTPHAYYMIHDGNFGEEGCPRSVINSVEYEKSNLEFMYDIYINNILERNEKGNLKINSKRAAKILNAKLPTGSAPVRVRNGELKLNRDHMEQLCSRDTYFTPDEAVELNLADRLLKTNDLSGALVNQTMCDLPNGMENLQLDV